jgi:chlorobactene glucosyltransferase
MADYFTHALIIHIIIFQAAILLVILTNSWFLHRSRRHTPPLVFPKVSILVPARDEEESIAACIQSLLAQEYPAFEVLVLDDQSSDSTRPILDQIAAAHPRLKVLSGSPLPDGHSGKNWACVQLARQAQGDLFFFTDADTLHAPQTLRHIVTALIGEQADLLTGFPRQQVNTWGERLLVPFFSWAFYCFLPLGMAYKLRSPAVSNAVGQMMLFRRQSYQAIGGHDGVGTSVIDDLMLARRIKAAGLRWRVTNVRDLITCRMYRGSRAAFEGFSKNIFAVFDFRLVRLLFVYLWLAAMFWEPLIVLALSALGRAPLARPDELAVSIGLSLLLWLIPYWELGLPFGLAFLYPLTLLANEMVAFQSLRLSLAGRLTWKGRQLAQPRWKWF